MPAMWLALPLCSGRREAATTLARIFRGIDDGTVRFATRTAAWP
eukprot:CAMPEP_0168418164 /NCGR_PEP_ID=MMETSP0228-20121227/31626_1 /TAXON_ID=133427 /ORGANISM="Protoceratium reticulatum, Strain CCCM 535 (=CCMP 1889)" /LENGTH=43 /DNA_ID= /DNA_START= /DNA_END= /DNA_ORIENTATION=